MLNRSHRKTLSTVGCRSELMCRHILPQSKSAPPYNHKDLLFVPPGPEVCLIRCVCEGEVALERGCLSRNCGVVSDGAMLVDSHGGDCRPAQRHIILHFMQPEFAANRLEVLAR